MLIIKYTEKCLYLKGAPIGLGGDWFPCIGLKTLSKYKHSKSEKKEEG